MGKMKELWYKYTYGLPLTKDEMEYIREWEKEVQKLEATNNEDN